MHRSALRLIALSGFGVAIALKALAADAVHVVKTRPSVAGDASLCNGTVAYAFVASAGLPLEKVWRAYFDGCPAGSYAVIVHSQQMVQPSLVPEALLVDDPMQGNLRFKYAMIEAMFKLYREANGSATPNGCKPHWVQLLSDSCAPVGGCGDFHDFLASREGTSFVGDGDNFILDTPMGERRRPTPWLETFWYKASQWTTLWMPHVRLLLDEEEANYPQWKDAYCPDEHYTANVLTLMGANISRRSLTFSHFNQNPVKKLISNEHPNTVSCPREEEIRAHNATPGEVTDYHLLVGEAIESGKRFMRKFDPNCVDRLLELLVNSSDY